MSQAIDPPPVPIVSMSIIGIRIGNGPTDPAFVTCGLPPSIRQRSVEVPPASRVTTSGKPAMPAMTALPSAPAAGPDKAVVIGLRTTSLALATPPLDCITRNGTSLSPSPELVVHAPEIAFHVRLDESVDQRRHRALVLAVFRQDGGGQRQRRLRVLLRDDLGGTPLMGGVGIGVDQRNADGADAALAEEPRRGAHARFVQWTQLFALVVEPAADLAHEAQRHDPFRLHPEIRVAVALGHRLPRDLENVAEARGDDQPERGDLTLQQRVGGDGGAVGEAGDVRSGGAGLLQDRRYAAHKSHCGIRRRARDLGDPHRTRTGVDGNDVGEGPAGVDADPKARSSCLRHPCLCRPHSPRCSTSSARHVSIGPRD